MKYTIVLTEGIEFISCYLLCFYRSFNCGIYFLGSCFTRFLFLLRIKLFLLALSENIILSFVQLLDSFIDLVGYITKILHVSFSSF